MIIIIIIYDNIFILRIYHVNMFKCALQESTELTVERRRSFATAAHKYFIYQMLSVEENEHRASGSLP